ncbi:hypothetical protein ES702_06858 [subsurface metagenome]
MLFLRLFLLSGFLPLFLQAFPFPSVSQRKASLWSHPPSPGASILLAFLLLFYLLLTSLRLLSSLPQAFLPILQGATLQILSWFPALFFSVFLQYLPLFFYKEFFSLPSQNQTIVFSVEMLLVQLFFLINLFFYLLSFLGCNFFLYMKPSLLNLELQQYCQIEPPLYFINIRFKYYQI